MPIRKKEFFLKYVKEILERSHGKSISAREISQIVKNDLRTHPERFPCYMQKTYGLTASISPYAMAAYLMMLERSGEVEHENYRPNRETMFALWNLI